MNYSGSHFCKILSKSQSQVLNFKQKKEKNKRVRVMALRDKVQHGCFARISLIFLFEPMINSKLSLSYIIIPILLASLSETN